jgi:hypothetical protein
VGLFSSDYKYIAHAGSSPLFEEDNRPETVKSTVVQVSTAEDPPTLAAGIRFALGTDLYSRSKAIMRYAQKNYYYGFPEASEDLIYADYAEIDAIISAEVGEPVTISNVETGRPEMTFLVNQFIKENYLNLDYFPWPSGDPLNTDWDQSQETTEIPVLNPAAEAGESPYYVVDNSPEYVEIVEYVFSGEDELPSRVVTGYKIEFDYTDSEGNPASWAVDGDINLSSNEEMITVAYSKDSDPDTTLYWNYLIGSGEYLDLEESLQTISREMNFMPIILLMRDKVWFDETEDQELIDTTKGICKRLNVDPFEVKEDYLKQVEEDIANGDRPKKNLDEWDFFIHFSVPMHCEERGSIEYLYHLFKLLQDTQVSTRSTYEAAITNETVPYSSLKITEGGDNGYNSEYRWAYIETKTHEGVFSVNGVELRPRRSHIQLYKYGDADYAEGIYQVHGEGAQIAPPGLSKKNEDLHHYVVVTYQETEDTYTQVLMMGPSMRYAVNTREDPTKQKGHYRVRYAECELFPEDPEEESEFRWPIHYASLQEVSRVRREQVLAEGFCATVYLVEKQEVKWYQKGFFKWLIIIIAVILIVLSIIFPGFAAAAAMLLTAAIGGGMLTFYIIYAILMFAIGFIISMAGSLVGGTWGTVLAVVGAIISLQAGLAGAPGGAGYGISTAGANSWGSAISLINSTAPYLKGATQIYSAIETEALQDDIEKFEKQMFEQQRELDEMRELLGDGGGLDPMYLLSDPVLSFVYEAPDAYYERTLNANPGVLGYDFIYRFHDLALALPEKPFEANFIENMYTQLAEQRGQG